MERLPKDPVMCMSAVNTLLRDRYDTLDELCEDLGEDREELERRLAFAGFSYEREQNQFR